MQRVQADRKTEAIRVKEIDMSAAIQIEAVLKQQNRPMYLHEIREAIVEQFGAWHSESAISARIRDSVRPKLLAQGVSLIGKAQKGKSAWQYSLVYTKSDIKQIETSLMLMCLST